MQPLDALRHRPPVRQQSAQPAVVDVGHPDARRLARDRILCLLLGADEQHGAAALGDRAHEAVRVVEQLLRLLQVDDVDTAALGEDESLHLRVPATGLVAEVNAGLQQVLHGDNGHGKTPSFSVSVGIPPAAPRRDRQNAGHRPPRASTGSRVKNAGMVPGKGQRPCATRYASRSSGSGDSTVEVLRRERMLERQARGVQELPVESRRADTVERVADDGQADCRQVDADLVHAAGLQTHREQRVVVPRADDVEVCDGVAGRVAVQRDAGRVIAVAADRGLDPAAPRPGCAADEREVGALERPPADERRQPLIGLRRAGDDEQARRVAVEAVHDPRPLRVAAGDRSGKRVDERVAALPCARMDDEAGGLVDDGEMLVLPGDARRRHRRDG